MNDLPILTILTFLPVVGSSFILFMRDGLSGLNRLTALGTSLIALVITIALWLNFDGANSGYQFEQRLSWIPTIGVEYHVGVDGLGMAMVLLTGLLVPFALFVSPGGEGRGYYSLVLFLQAGLFGTFTALNFVHWFVFWELALIPAFFLIKGWGGRLADRAALQFFIYTMVGSIALLLAFLALFLAAGRLELVQPFGFAALAEAAQSGQIAPALAVSLQLFETFSTEQGLMQFIFCLSLLGFAVKLPIWPFHTWLPATYTEAPTPVTMLLTGAMSKMGAYGLLRILLPIFPREIMALQTPLLWLAIASVVLGAAAALRQSDLKRILAYSSVNHLGYVALAVFASVSYMVDEGAALAERSAALNGAVLQMFNHGITAAALFGFVSLIERRAGGLRGLDDFGGLRKVAPVFTGLFGISLFASLGLPGLNGFVGEFLIFKGVFALKAWAAVFALPGLLLTAWLLLNVLQRVFSGPLNERWKEFPDLTPRELWIMIPPTALMFALGIWPQWLLGKLNETLKALAAVL
ncbi:MAG TPA: NADH-quinone oxidoreductase subunit M [Verrucomicrobiales bacterium]|nr:NADH-quinone oxidoreductase subunit M [Verrucomicrobiales bacterium]